MIERSNALGLLRTALGDPKATFHHGQWQAIDSLVNRQEKLLVVQRTGWGKSSVYFITTRILRDSGRGPTLIISPLLALMRNQIDAAERFGVKTLTVNSTNKNDWQAIYKAIRANKIDALLISPERLANDEFVTEVLLPISETVGLLVVDEAHCISDWGHDFRPDYRRLINVLQRLPDSVPILGTTATANNRVVHDARTQLGNIGVQRGSLMRETLELQNIYLPTQAARLAWLAEHLGNFSGTGIIYTLTKRDADQVADWLKQNDISARAYYAGVKDDAFEDSNAYREHLENLLLNNEIKVLVATSSLGMGYDKPDLGFVIHYQAPGSIISYYQQVGRAGRGIDTAIGVLLSGREDEQIHRYFRESAFPKERYVLSILDALETSDGLTIGELEESVNVTNGQIQQVVKFLSVDNPAPLIKDGSKWKRTPVPYRMDHEHIKRLVNQREAEWHEVQLYLNNQGCLMEFLAQALDDEEPSRCGRCANCQEKAVITNSFSHKTAASAGRFLQHAEAPLECKKQVAFGSFKEYGFSGNFPNNLRANVGRVLSRWGDAGYGQIVADDKHSGYFCDELVEAVKEMIIERWRPNPKPMWITCVPSIKHPTLVPNYAKRLAATLGLPFLPIVQKVRDNAQQKGQQNRFHQCQNLDGVFAIKENIPEEPVLLVDDVVNSAWTLTVIAALLRQKGSGPVWPLALTNSRIGA